MIIRVLAAVAALFLAAPAMAVLMSAPVQAQAYPSKPVRFVVPFAPGGTTDILARLVGQKLSEVYGQQFVIENRAGAGGNIGAEIVAKAPSDGYTILMGTPGTQAINQYVYRAMPYDTAKDFAPVSLVALVANVLAVNPQVPARDLKELIALAKARPGTLNFATPGNGTTGHLSTELMKAMAGIDLTHVPYRGSGPALQDLLAGQVQMTIDNIPSALPHIQGGALRALAVTSAKRWFALPDVPTMAEAGIPNYEATSWFVVMAPARTPADIVNRLSAEIDTQLRTEDMRKKFREVGAEPVGGTPAALGAFLTAEQTKWKGVVEAAKVRLD